MVSLLYLFGWRRKLAERAHRRGFGSLSSLRWTLAAEYQLPLGSFLGIAALLVVYAPAVAWLSRFLPGSLLSPLVVPAVTLTWPPFRRHSFRE